MSLCNVSFKKGRVGCGHEVSAGGWDGGDMKTSYGLGDKSQSVWVNKRHLSIITKATGVPRSREG